MSLPSLAQLPSLELRYDAEGAQAGAPFAVTYEMRWVGDAADFVVVPAEVEPVAWGGARTVETRSWLEDGSVVIAQTVEFVADKAGEVEIPPFSVGYFDPELMAVASEGETAALPEQQFLRADAFTIRVKPGAGRYALIASAIALLMCVALVWFWRSRRGQMIEATAGGVAVPTPETVPASINLARQYRLDGKFYEFYRELVRAASLLPSGSEARGLGERLERIANEVGYRGLRPTDDDMDGVLKDLEQLQRQGGTDTN